MWMPICLTFLTEWKDQETVFQSPSIGIKARLLNTYDNSNFKLIAAELGWDSEHGPENFGH